MPGYDESPVVRFARRVGIGVFLILAPLYILLQIWLVFLALSTSWWPTAAGELTRAEVRTLGGQTYAPVVAYVYEVAGERYEGHRLRLHQGNFKRRTGAGVALEGLRPGQAVVVSFDPSDPGRSVLYPGLSSLDVASIVAIFCFSAMWLGVARRLIARREPSISSACNP